MATPTNPLAGRRFVDEAGNPVVPGQELGAGGGGTVYEVTGQPDDAVKIWHSNAIPEDADVKIRHMVNNPVTPELGANWRITWPRHLVTENGNIVGYVMPKLDYTLPWQPIIGYYNPSAARGTGAEQGREIRIENRVRIASNLALAFKAVHDAGYVIGDINQSNAEANRLDDVALMDCDSYGFTDPATGRVFSDNMAQDGYQAPEFQGDFVRGPEQDRFGLAVLIFFLLTGSHPYMVTGRQADDYKTYSERIRAWLFPPTSSGSVTAPDYYNDAWNALTDKQQELFRRCFDRKHEGEPRPKPEEWVEALLQMPALPAPAPATPAPAPQPSTAPQAAIPVPTAQPAVTQPRSLRQLFSDLVVAAWLWWLLGGMGVMFIGWVIHTDVFLNVVNLLLLITGIIAVLIAIATKHPVAIGVGVIALAIRFLNLLDWAVNLVWTWVIIAGLAAVVIGGVTRIVDHKGTPGRIAVGTVVLAAGVWSFFVLTDYDVLSSDEPSPEARFTPGIAAPTPPGDSSGTGGGGETSGGGSGAGGGNEPSEGGGSGPSSQAPVIPGGETPPTVTLELSSSSISENGGSATVTASLSSPSSAITTLTVDIAPGPGADSADYTLSKSTLTIEAGSTTSADSLTVSAIDNTADAPDKTVSIYGSASNALGAVDPAAVTLTIVDDDGAPGVTLELSSYTISEDSGAANVTASLSGPSSEDVTVVVSASPEPPAAEGDFTITSNNTLTIAAGSTVSAGTVTITAIDNGVDEPDKYVTVSATMGGSRGVAPPSSQTLTITDDEVTPRATLQLSSSSISENGEVTNVTAALSGPSSQDVTLTVSVSPASPAASGDYAVSSNNVLTIEAGSTQSTDTVTITAIDNSVDEPHKNVTVSATATGHEVAAPPSLTLAITDDDGAPAVALDLSPSSISENGGVAIVTATLSPPSSQPVAVYIYASPVSPAAEGDFTISSSRSLSIAAGSTSAAGTVTITGVDNSVDGPDKSVTVSATVTGRDVTAPSSRTLTITDDEAAPTVTLLLSASSISENGGATSVDASLSGPSSQDVIIAVSASPTSHAVSDDFTMTSNNTLTIAAGSTHSMGTVTITAVDNSVDEPDKSVTVSASATRQEVADPSSLTLAITDDEATPVTLELNSYSISENGGAADVTAYLGVPSSQDVTVVVSATPVSPAVEGDFTVSSNNTLTIAAGSTHSTNVVTITAVDNSLDGPDKSVTVSATVSGRDVTAPASQTLTIADDEDAPALTLILSASSIGENGGAANVTASLSHPSSQDVAVVVSASPEPPALSSDFIITSNTTLTIAAGSTRSTGVVTITGVDNRVDGPDKSVMVSATVSGDQGVGAPSGHSLAITDDDATPTVTLEISASSISENRGVADVSAYLSGPSSQDVTVEVSVTPVSPAVDGDFTITPNNTLTIAAGSTRSTGVVAITAVDNRVDAPHKSVTVSAAVSGGHGLSDPSGDRLTIRDDDDAPTLTLELSPSSISENGGVANVTASLSHPSSQDVVLEISASPESGDFTITSNRTLTIEAGATNSTGTVTITGVDNSVVEPDNKSVLVWATVSDSRGVSDPQLQLLIITDDDAPA